MSSFMSTRIRVAISYIPSIHDAELLLSKLPDGFLMVLLLLGVNGLSLFIYIYICMVVDKGGGGGRGTQIMNHMLAGAYLC